MSNGKLAASAALVVVCLAATAHAGFKYSSLSVVVDQNFRFAYGSLGATRNSASTQEYLGCSYFGTSAGCEAWAVNGGYVACWTSDPAMAGAAARLSSDGGVYFSWDGNGNCTSIVTSSYSYYDPKAP